MILIWHRAHLGIFCPILPIQSLAILQLMESLFDNHCFFTKIYLQKDSSPIQMNFRYLKCSGPWLLSAFHVYPYPIGDLNQQFPLEYLFSGYTDSWIFHSYSKLLNCWKHDGLSEIFIFLLHLDLNIDQLHLFCLSSWKNSQLDRFHYYL